MNKFTARILIVEDDPQIRNFISYVLSAEGFASDNAATAQSAMTLLAANVYDLMLLDLGYAAEDAGPLPTHSQRKDLSETVTYI